MKEFLMLLAFFISFFIGLSAGWLFISREGQTGNTISDGEEYQREFSRYKVFYSIKKRS